MKLHVAVLKLCIKCVYRATIPQTNKTRFGRTHYPRGVASSTVQMLHFCGGIVCECITKMICSSWYNLPLYGVLSINNSAYIYSYILTYIFIYGPVNASPLNGVIGPIESKTPIRTHARILNANNCAFTERYWQHAHAQRPSEAIHQHLQFHLPRHFWIIFLIIIISIPPNACGGACANALRQYEPLS